MPHKPQLQMPFLPVARPLLPAASAIFPYLERIDTARIYSNFGPLCAELEKRLSDLAEIGGAECLTATNATVMLSAVLLSVAHEGADLCIMPSWTFCASAHAVFAAGLTPFFADVDPETWQLTPDLVAKCGVSPERIAVVMVVAPFGKPVDLSQWSDYQSLTGTPVVIDAAAAMGNQTYGNIPVIVSLHPTKSLGAGEGGFLITTDGGLIQMVRARLNFGFPGKRIASFPAFNGKMSEFGAAVALAALDQWDTTRRQWQARLALYEEALSTSRDVAIFNKDVVTSTLVVTSKNPDGLADALREASIDTRKWWNIGCHAEPAFAACPRAVLDVTQKIAASSLGLPFFRDMEDADILRVSRAIVGSQGA